MGMYKNKLEAERAFCFTTTRLVTLSWKDRMAFCEKCGCDIPYGEKAYVIYDIYGSPRCPVQIYHEECYAKNKH